ncbi:telomere stability and silencing-domain-containing protein [Obelidium mucronatum]|nr:telomere stability and silencing-domain-containing protein [Obelidium mucronatum]
MATMDAPPTAAAAAPPLRLRGGKGGFGSMLRAQGGRMASQKTTNFEACRDLSGRRLKTVNDAKKIADYKEAEPERKRKLKEELKAKIEKGLKEPEVKKIRYDDPEFEETHEQVLDDVKDTVKKALQKKSVPLLKAKKTSAPATATVTKKRVWGDDSDSDEDEDNEESEEERN